MAALQLTIQNALSIRHVLTVPHVYTCLFQHADLLRVQNLPAWPAAGTVLIRCINALGGPKGLQHPDASVRQISVDLLGLIAAHLYKDALSQQRTIRPGLRSLQHQTVSRCNLSYHPKLADATANAIMAVCKLDCIMVCAAFGGTKHPCCADCVLHKLHTYLFFGLLSIPGSHCCFPNMSAQ